MHFGGNACGSAVFSIVFRTLYHRRRYLSNLTEPCIGSAADISMMVDKMVFGKREKHPDSARNALYGQP